jgi:hypothetical protein
MTTSNEALIGFLMFGTLTERGNLLREYKVFLRKFIELAEWHLIWCGMAPQKSLSSDNANDQRTN